MTLSKSDSVQWVLTSDEGHRKLSGSEFEEKLVSGELGIPVFLVYIDEDCYAESRLVSADPSLLTVQNDLKVSIPHCLWLSLVNQERMRFFGEIYRTVTMT